MSKIALKITIYTFYNVVNMCYIMQHTFYNVVKVSTRYFTFCLSIKSVCKKHAFYKRTLCKNVALWKYQFAKISINIAKIPLFYIVLKHKNSLQKYQSYCYRLHCFLKGGKVKTVCWLIFMQTDISIKRHFCKVFLYKISLQKACFL